MSFADERETCGGVPRPLRKIEGFGNTFTERSNGLLGSPIIRRFDRQISDFADEYRLFMRKFSLQGGLFLWKEEEKEAWL